MRKTLAVIGILVVLLILILVLSPNNTQDQSVLPGQNQATTTDEIPVEVTPITHATAILEWAGTTIYTDPTGGTTTFQGKPAANIVVVTDIHGDHLSTSTLNSVIGSSTILIVPQAVKNMLPKALGDKARVLANGSSTDEQGFRITAIPMYNTPEASDNRHTKGRGNGYVIERDGYRVYIAGDTDGIPEMRALTDIDMAFVPMNPPFTMDVDEAADAVLAFKPKIVYPYHYRGQAGLSDVNRFKQLVNAGDPNINVILENWYPQQ